MKKRETVLVTRGFYYFKVKTQLYEFCAHVPESLLCTDSVGALCDSGFQNFGLRPISVAQKFLDGSPQQVFLYFSPFLTSGSPPGVPPHVFRVLH